MSLSSLGKIVEISQTEKGYKRVVLSVNAPFKTMLIKFNVWEDTLPQDADLANFKVSDEVRADYHYNKGYPRLDRLTLAAIDSCPVCYNYLEAIDARRTDCHGCSSMPDSACKLRVNARYKLKSKTIESYRYSSGYKLRFGNEETKEELTCVIFEGNPLFATVSDLNVSSFYNVVGWKNTEKSEFRFVDIIDIC